MNTPSWFILGTIIGMGAASAFFYFRDPASHAHASITPTPPGSLHSPAAKPAPPSTNGVAAPGANAAHSAVNDQALKDALREIREADMVVIPQEFARFLMPSLLSTNPEPAVRQILQLDEREAAALAKARTKFENALQQTIDAHLRVIEVKDGVVTATLPAFADERQKLINAWRAESLAALDSESAAIASHIDFDRAISGLSQGRFDLGVTFKPSSDFQKVAVEYRGQSANGDHRENYSYRGNVPAAHFLKRLPSLQSHFPQLVEETKP